MRCAAKLLALLLCIGGTGTAHSGNDDLLGERMPYAAFDAMPKTRLEVGGGKLDVAFAEGTFALSNEKLLDWIKKSATAVSVYYGRFPVAETRILVVPVPGRGVRRGTAFGYRGPALRLAVGSDSTEDDLNADWKCVHEMIHLALANVTQDHVWLAEGLAVYIESISRVQAGHLRAQKIWHEFARDMPQGLPQKGDGGLEGTQSWGRTYWGGAIFCLLADVEMRKLSGNKLGLQDAMRGVVQAGGTHDLDWPVARILSVADQAVGMTVMAELYDKMGKHGFEPQLVQLWGDLGVVDGADGATFNEDAPLAAVRRAITAPPSQQ